MTPSSSSKTASTHQKHPPAKTASARLLEEALAALVGLVVGIFSAIDLSSAVGMNLRTSPLMQKRRPVGRGPSSKTWPRWESQRAQLTSTRVMPWDWSVFSAMFSLAMGWKKLGQPVPDSNFVSDLKRGRLQPTQA